MEQVVGEQRRRQLAQPPLQQRAQVVDARAFQYDAHFVVLRIEILFELVIELFGLLFIASNSQNSLFFGSTRN